ncbi:MAG TPA: redoxin family protein [Pyrinomonadaceae bacterium]|nr:redoxin family protein [Pyrinomonadaceae bacterium]
MHRQNLLAIGLLLLVAAAVLAVGYANGRGPLDTLSYGVKRLSNRGSVTTKPDLVSESNAPSAPEFAAGTWVNSEPLTIKDLRGRVVLVEFWTFGCYNCRNTLPFIKAWDSRYRDKGLTVVGVHSPEFAEEKQVENVRREVASLGIHYPVVTDNDYATWRAYDVEAWPTIFVLDKDGHIRWNHVGEGAYDQTEQVIEKLLAEPDTQENKKTEAQK